MHLSKQISESTAARDFANLQRYQNRQPSIYNHYYAINLITAVEKLPPLSKPTHETEGNLQEYKTESRGVTEISQVGIQNKVNAYHHEIDRLNLDVQINQYAIGNVLLGRGAHSTVRLAKSKDGHKDTLVLKNTKEVLHKAEAPGGNGQRGDQSAHAVETSKHYPAQGSYLLCGKGKNVHCSRILFQRVFVDRAQQQTDRRRRRMARGSARLLQTDGGSYFLQYASHKQVHENKVVHRDIKPENMLLSEQGKIKIIDFNISHDLKNNEKLRVTNKFIGTKGYAAPELIIGTDRQKMIEGKALDIWSLGITLLELLERKHPFSVKTIEQLHKYLSQDILINETYPEQLKKLLRGMLSRSNEERMKIEQVKRNGWVKGK